jgi:hypothetical protein
LFDSPLHDAAGSQISPYYSIMMRGVKSRRCILQRGVKSLRCMMQGEVKSMIDAEIFPLHDAAGSQTFLLHFAGSQILPLNDAVGSQFDSGELSLKTLEDSLGP